MKKYYADDVHDDTGKCNGCDAVYLASDVDAFMTAAGLTNWATQAGRIAELEKALRDVRGEIESYSGLRAEYQDWTDAINTIDSALMER